jgi:DNA-binding transcriptional ArsR family regulator
MTTEDAVFKAIAHPARRGILGLLAVSARSVKELTAEFDMSQPAISQHLKELREAELVASERVGLEQRYRLNPRPLRHVLRWTEGYRALIDPAGHVWSFAPARSRVNRQPSKRTRRNGN